MLLSPCTVSLCIADYFTVFTVCITESAGYSIGLPGLRYKGSVIYVEDEMSVRRVWHVRKIKGK